jgi:mannose-1-phosphate guanylyltransferase/mannose-1-phosphate guanylyltransferase/mannose-6-phosphate isomerase
VSRESYPKQFLPLAGEQTLLQQSALRVGDPARYGPLTLVSNIEHRFLVAEQLRAVGLEATILLEPMRRNTAAAVAAALLDARERSPDGLLLVMPADHVIRDEAAFHRAVEIGVRAAVDGALVLFGVTPDHPATGYGYIEVGAALADLAPVSRVKSFQEKPDRATAETFVAGGEHLWNSGVFLLPIAATLAEYRKRAPEVLAAVEAAMAAGRKDLDFFRLDEAAFAQAPSIAIDKAIMEKTDRAAVAPVDMGWTDVGAWSALREIGDHDPAGNVSVGDTILHQAENCFVRSDGPLVAAVGVSDLTIIATPDAVLVSRNGEDDALKVVVDALAQRGHPAATTAPRVHRPWGWYESIDAADGFQVKRIVVRPGQKLSLQKHERRAEHWVVVSGVALVTIGDEQKLLRRNQSTYVPIGETHRLENRTDEPLTIIEVQSGDYLGEDDIIRLEDIYSRVEAGLAPAPGSMAKTGGPER